MLASTIFEVIGYIEKPVLEKDKNSKWKYLIKRFFSLLFIVVTVNICVLSALMLYQTNQKVNFDNIVNQTNLKSFSNLYFLITLIFINPLIAETIFRGFLHKAKKNFTIFFYISAILYGVYQLYLGYSHQNTTFLGILLFFLTQFFSGLVLGFVRIRYGFSWSYALNVLIHIISETILLSFLFL